MRLQHRRLVRMGCKLLLVISLAASGYLLANTGHTNAAAYAIITMVLSLAAAIAAESLATSTEDELTEIEERIASNGKRHAETLAARDEKLNKMERISKVLESQNHNMRAELISLMVRKQRSNE